MRQRIRLMLGIGIGAVTLAAGCAPTPAPPAPAPTVSPAPTASPSPTVAPAPTFAPVRVLRIMPLGDSITYGLGSTDHGGYRGDLALRFAAARFRVDFVGSQQAGPLGADDDNEGHGGWTIAQIAFGVGNWLAAYRPDVVLLHAGTNDLQRTNSAGAAARLGILLDRIRRDAPSTQIFVAQIIGSDRPSLQRRVAVYNAEVARLVVARQDPLMYLVDQGGVRAPEVHPNDAGYAAMASNWFAAVIRVDAAGAVPVRAPAR